MQPKPDDTLYRVRVINRRQVVLFAEAMRGADTGRPLPFDGAELARPGTPRRPAVPLPI